MQTAAVEYGVLYLGVWTGRQTLVWRCRSVSWAARCRPVTHTLFQPAAWPGPSCPPRPSGPPNHPPSAWHGASTDRSNPTTRHAPCSAHKHRQHHKPDPRAASGTKTNKTHFFCLPQIQNDRIITIAFALRLLSLPSRTELLERCRLWFFFPVGIKRSQDINARRIRSQCFMHSVSELQ